MEWYLVIPILAGWIILCYGWAITGPQMLDSLVGNHDGLAELLYWLIGMSCLLSWPLAAFAFRVRFDWYWWLLMFDLLGLPWSLSVSSGDIAKNGYTYGEKGEGAQIEWTFMWLVVTAIWPLQCLRKRFKLL